MNSIPLLLAVLTSALGLALVKSPRSNPEDARSRLSGLRKETAQKRAMVASTGALGASVAIWIHPGSNLAPNVLLGALLGGGLTWLIEKRLATWRRKARIAKLDSSLVALLSQIHLQLLNGRSLHAALSGAKGVLNKDVSLLQVLARSGMDLDMAVGYWIEDFDTNTKKRVGDLLLTRASTSETISLTLGLIQQLKNEQRFALIASIERRNQLVWIPVTIAVLVPGMIFIAIPLEATLRSLLG